jgi:hypothetical protein
VLVHIEQVVLHDAEADAEVHYDEWRDERRKRQVDEANRHHQRRPREPPPGATLRRAGGGSATANHSDNFTKLISTKDYTCKQIHENFPLHTLLLALDQLQLLVKDLVVSRAQETLLSHKRSSAIIHYIMMRAVRAQQAICTNVCALVILAGRLT